MEFIQNTKYTFDFGYIWIPRQIFGVSQKKRTRTDIGLAETGSCADRGIAFQLREVTIIVLATRASNKSAYFWLRTIVKNYKYI